MTEILTDYFQAFLHPFRTQRQYGDQNATTKQLRLASNSETDSSSFLTFPESLTISWGFVLIQTILIVLTLPLGSMAVEHMASTFEWEEPLVKTLITKWQLISIFAILFEAIIYPAFIWFYMKLWGVLIRFFGHLYESNEVNEKSIEQVSSVALTSHVFLLVPIFGSMIRHVALVVYLFAGLRENMKMSRAQALMIIVSPLFVLTITGLMMFIYFLVLFSSI